MTATGKADVSVRFDPSIPEEDREQFTEELSSLGFDVHASSAQLRRSSSGELTTIILIALPLQAFLAALGGKLADDAYSGLKRVLRSLLDRHRAPPAASGAIVLQDARTGLLIRLDARLSDAAWNQLRELDLSAFRYGPISYDRANGRWRSELDEMAF